MKPLTKVLIITTLIFRLCNVCNGQKSSFLTKPQIRPEILKIVDSIATDNILSGISVGNGGMKSDQWKRYEKLNEKASDEELKVLTDNENAVVRCYSFQALASRKNVDVFPILIKYINDTTNLGYQGCIISSLTAADYFLHIVNDSDSYTLSEGQINTIDSILLFDKSIQISSKYNLLSDLAPDIKYYNRIREIALTEKSSVAILALSRFQNENDIELIKTLFDSEQTEYYAAYSAREFPHSSFYPFLTRIFKKEWTKKLYDYPKWRILYQALAKYPTPKTYKLFEKTTKTKDEFRHQTLGVFLTIALTKYPNEIFEPLKNQIKLDEYHMIDVKKEMNIEK